MTDPRSSDTTPLNPPDRADDLAAILRELAGDEERVRQDGILDTDQVEFTTGTATDTDLYEGGSGPMGADDPIDSPQSLELLEDLELRSDETADPNLAAEEGLAWIPPVDPPFVPSSNPEGAVMAAGFSSSSLDEPYDGDHGSSVLASEDEMTGRVREALRADATTTEYADTVEIETDGGRVILRGTVEDLDDDDNLVAVASTVAGVDEVVDRLEVATL